jgi:YVTN family beta-propeller protein
MEVARGGPGSEVGAAHAAPDAEQFGPYRLAGLIGRGGMGEVHRAYDLDRDRVVALKRMPRHLGADPGFRARFEAEARIAARMRNPHVIPIHDYGEIDGQLFIDMRLVDGLDLKSRLERERRLSPARAVAIVAQIAGALDEAHAAGLVHRDVKPSNVLTVEDDFVYLIDFGLARELSAPRLTSTGITLGTLAYMAPEQFDAAGDHRADVYALACVLHEMLTGQAPFPVRDFMAIMHAHAATPPPRASRMVPGVPPALDEVVARGMAKDPAHRFAGAGALAAAARAALVTAPLPIPVAPLAATPVPAPPVPALSPRERAALAHAGRRPPGVVSGLVIAGVLVAVVVMVVVLISALSAGQPVADGARAAAGEHTPAGSGAVAVPAVVGRLQVGDSPRDIAVSADGLRLFATNRDDGIVSVVNTSTGSVESTTDLGAGSGPEGIAVTPDGRTSFVVDNEASSVTVVDNATGRVRRTIPVALSPTDVAVAPDGRTAFVTSTDGGTLMSLDAQQVLTSVTADGRPQSLALSPDGATAYVTDGGNNTLITVDTHGSTVLDRIPVGAGPGGVALSPDGTTAYVVGVDDNAVSVVDLKTRTVAATIPVGTRPVSVAVRPDGLAAYVTDNGGGSVSVIDTVARSVVGELPVGSKPEAVAVAPDGERAYVVNSGDGTVSVLDLAGRAG